MRPHTFLIRHGHWCSGGAVRATLAPLVALAHHDFCPWANRYVDWLKQPIGWFLVGTGAAAASAMFLEPQAWVLVGSLVAVIVLGTVWPSLAIRGVSAEMNFDRRRCRAGDGVPVRLTVHHRGPWPLRGLAVENGFFFETPDAVKRPVLALARIAGWSRSEFLFEFQPEARGVYPREAPELVTGFPFGIWRAARKIAVRHEMLVWPRMVPVPAIPLVGGEPGDGVAIGSVRPGAEGDMLGVRPFRSGDRFRSIHWAHTARRDALVVVERQQAMRRRVVVVVDGDAFSLPSDQKTMESAISLAASIAQELHAQQAEVRFVLRELDMQLSPDAAGLHRLLDALARFRGDQPSPSPPPRLERNALVIVLTTPACRSKWERRVGMRSSLRLLLIDDAGVWNSPARVAGSPRRNGWLSKDGRSDTESLFVPPSEPTGHDCLAK